MRDRLGILVAGRLLEWQRGVDVVLGALEQLEAQAPSIDGLQAPQRRMVYSFLLLRHLLLPFIPPLPKLYGQFRLPLGHAIAILPTFFLPTPSILVAPPKAKARAHILIVLVVLVSPLSLLTVIPRLVGGPSLWALACASALPGASVRARAKQ